MQLLEVFFGSVSKRLEKDWKYGINIDSVPDFRWE